LISNQWRIALKLQQLFPNLKQLVEQVTLSTKDKQDKSSANFGSKSSLQIARSKFLRSSNIKIK